MELKELEQVMERKRKKKEKNKGKRKEKSEGQGQYAGGDTPPAKNKIQEDVEMLDEGRFSLYEDLSDYEKQLEVKDEAPVIPPVTKRKSLPNVRWDLRQRNP